MLEREDDSLWCRSSDHGEEDGIGWQVASMPAAKDSRCARVSWDKRF